MAVFGCAGCGAVLTVPVSRVALPVHARQNVGHDLLPALMEPGTYAVDDEPSGPPWRPWSEIGAELASVRGVFAPVPALSFGAPGAVAVAPGDTRGTVLIPERCDGYCLGLDGRDGPNLACAGCGRPVATRIDDCTFWQAVWLDPRAVFRLPDDRAEHRTGRRTATVSGGRTPPEEPAGTPPMDASGRWNPRWEAAIGAALAPLLAASAGAAVDVADRLTAEFFARTLDAVLPAGPPARRVVLAGPGLPAPGSPRDIALVPLDPRTGTARQPAGSADTVPLAAEVWTYLAFPRRQLPIPATGGLPAGVLRDDPLPLHPTRLFEPDRRILLHALARLPAVRRPWLRAIHDRLNAHPYG
ncbi:hypothetical protein SAMN05216223_11453 [Actinacidiphila yanglinensis]|uniref:Uncharacterized protein n=1 Tax=Actinacidiphila yanglinensis TaxID=310779 RepID=A0A1H6DDK8_9ACTN|nr:hypothetical protein [Actinacidiphila yanglinensis]SEG83344.1 hypothetical protein SAMN05216223_11453 [Actinacidiphila yanglinensis]